MAPPTTPSKSSALFKDGTRCSLQVDVRVKIVDPSTLQKSEDKVYILPKGSEVVTRGDPTPEILTGSVEPLSVDNASYRIFGILNLTVYDKIQDEEVDSLCHSNLRTVTPFDMSQPLPKDTIVQVKKPVLDKKGKKLASPSELLRIKSERPVSPRTRMELRGNSFPLSTACYSGQKVVETSRDFQVYGLLRVLHQDLVKLD